MTMRKTDEYSCIITLLKELKKEYPHYNLGRHLSTAFADYGDLWGTSDKELLFALTKYQAEQEMDSINIAESTYVERIYNDGLDLEHILDDEETEEEL
jgi:hypothetical protein